MRNTLSIVVMMFISLLFIWAATIWYFGNKTEKDFRQSLESHINKPGEKPFRLEILEYNKHFLGSSAKIGVSSDIPLLDDWLNDWLGGFELTLKSLNGPIFITKRGVDFGVSRWFINIDPERFSAEALDNLQRIFPETLPTAVLIVGFDKKSSFRTSFQTAWLDSELNAFYNLETSAYRGSLAITRLNYSTTDLELSAAEGTINFQYPDQTIFKNKKSKDKDEKIPENIDSSLVDVSNVGHVYKPVYKIISIQFPRLTINHSSLSNPVSASLTGRSQITFKNSMIDSLISLKLEQQKQGTNQSLPIDQLEITAQSSGIQQSRFLALMETKAELDSLMMQTQWELEEHGELPEGQDKIWQLQDQISKLQQQYPASFYKALFPFKNTLENNSPSINIQSSNESGKSSLIGFLKPSTDSRESTRLTHMLEAEAQVTLDDLLFAYISNKFGINKKQFSLSYKQNKLLMR